MRKMFLAALALIFGVAIGAPRSFAQASASADKTAPSYDMKAQSLLDLEQLQHKFVGLAEAVPQEKYTWRPGPGVRSISEVFLHVAGANYYFPTMFGAAPSPGFEGKNFETSTTDKAAIIDQLNKSFAYAHAAIEKLTNANFADPQKKLGPDANTGDVVYLLVTHAHEHLGQSIAYARVNSIEPPWTAEAEKKKAEAAPKDE
ncbi:MAG: DinB family protein [Candidatus Acidiferrales bacterium]